MTWRERARPIIAAVIERVGRADEKRLRRELAAAYPWGAKENHPYKAWLAEVGEQLSAHHNDRPRVESCEGQRSLFDG